MDVFYATARYNGAFDTGDVAVRKQKGDPTLTVTLPNNKNEFLQPVDGEVRVTIDRVITVMEEGSPPVEVTLVSRDPDTGGASDGDGIPPVIAMKSIPVEVLPGIDDLCPCAGPSPGVAWRNHRRYVSCVARAAKEIVKSGSMFSPVSGRPLRSHRRAFKAWWRFVREAARSDCGRRTRRRR